MLVKNHLKNDLVIGYIMKIKINKTSIILAMTFFISLSVFSQDSYIKNRWNFKLAGSMGPLYNMSHKKAPQFRVEANYGLLKNLEVGGYAGLSPYWSYKRSSIDPITGYPLYTSKKAIAPFYGVNANFHLLPFLIKKDNFRFDLYLAAKGGGYYISGNNSQWYKGLQWQVFLGGGLAFYPWKHLGIYSEYGYETKHYPTSKDKFTSVIRFGLTFKY